MCHTAVLSYSKLCYFFMWKTCYLTCTVLIKSVPIVYISVNSLFSQSRLLRGYHTLTLYYWIKHRLVWNHRTQDGLSLALTQPLNFYTWIALISSVLLVSSKCSLWSIQLFSFSVHSRSSTALWPFKWGHLTVQGTTVVFCAHVLFHINHLSEVNLQ